MVSNPREDRKKREKHEGQFVFLRRVCERERERKRQSERKLCVRDERRGRGETAH